MVTVPDRLEQAVGEAQDHDVLDRLLAQEMIHPIDLTLCQHLQHLRIQRPRRSQIMAKGFLDHNAAPAAALLFLHQPGGAELIDDNPEEAVSHRQIEKMIAQPVPFALSSSASRSPTRR